MGKGAHVANYDDAEPDTIGEWSDAEDDEADRIFGEPSEEEDDRGEEECSHKGRRPSDGFG